MLTDHLSARQAGTLAALVDTIVPPDEHPGGVEAGVLAALESVVAAHVDAYREILDTLDGQSAADLLAAAGPESFVHTVVGHVMTAYYNTPTAWAMVGFAVSE